MTTYPSAPVDEPTADTLRLLNADPCHRTDRQIILDAIETVAARNGGDPVSYTHLTLPTSDLV